VGHHQGGSLFPAISPPRQTVHAEKEIHHG
jgi:hypothetical protein